MSTIPYKNNGNGLMAADWQVLWQEADSRLAKSLNNQSLFLTSGIDDAGELVFTKTFFFGTTVTSSVSGAMTMAEAAIDSYNPLYSWKRIYSDTPFLNWIASAAIDNTSEPSMSIWPTEASQSAGIVRLTAPDYAGQTALAAALWPEGTTGTFTFGADDFLNYSLRVNKKIVNGITCSVAVHISQSSYPSVVEHQHWWEPIDVCFLDGVGYTFTWPIEYDKYRLIRFNNLQKNLVLLELQQMHNWSVSTSSVYITIPPMESRCVRAASYGPNRSWITPTSGSGRYFHTSLPLDPWWRSVLEYDLPTDTYQGNRCNITDPMNLCYLLSKISPQNIDSIKAWDTRFLYYGSGIGSDANHIGTPSGSWFNSLLNTGTKLGDVLYHKGQMVAVDTADGNKKHIINYTGIDNLGSDLSVIAASVGNSADDPNYIVITADEKWDLITLSTNLLIDSIGANAISFWNNYTASLGPVDYSGLDGILGTEFSTLLLTSSVASASTDYTWNTWEMPGDYTTLAITGTDSASVVSTAYSVGTMRPGPWNLKTTLQTVIDDIQSYNDAMITTATPKATIFGPGLAVSKSISVLYPIDGLIDIAYRNTWHIVTDTNGSASVSYNIFAPFAYRLGPPLGGYSYRRPSWPHYSDWHSLEMGTLNGYFPRTRRAIARTRLWDDWPNVQGFIKQSVPPFYKSYFEEPPFYENHPVALSSDVVNGIGTEQITGVGFLARYNNILQTPESWYRLGAWVNEGKVFRCPVAGDFIEDFASGSAASIAYYPASRDAILNGYAAPGDNDSLAGVGESDPGSGKVALPALPLTVEHYNACASVINGFSDYNTNHFVSEAQFNLLYLLEQGRGIGFTSQNYRPRTQYVAWDDSAAPTITTFASASGFTVLNSSSLPTPFFTAVTEKQAYWDGTTTTYDVVGSLMNTWAPITIAPENYRWITIDDARVVYTTLGAQFVLNELVAPGTLQVVDAITDFVVGSPGGAAFVYANALGWVNDADGDWVYTPDGYTTTNKAPIRSNIDRTDYILEWNPSGIYRTSYGALDTRLTALPFGAGPPQAIVGNQTLLYRSYGGQPMQAITWPRNYASYESDYSATDANALARYFLAGTVWGVTPRSAVNGLEGQYPEITPCTGSEQIITTAFENATCVMWPLDITGSI